MGHHTLASEQKDLELIIQQLSSHVKPFNVNSPVPKTALLHALDAQKFSVWINEKWRALLAGLL